jgi:YVTN family beta-propeller protein
MAENPMNGLIYIANSDSDEISVLDPKQQTVIQTISLAPYSGAKTGTMPNALTVSPDGTTLYVSNAGNNDVAVIDLGVKSKSVTDDVYGSEPIHSEAKMKGLIPTAWYPSGVYLSADGSQLMVTNAMGLGYGPNGQKQYIGDMVKGTLSFINIPDDKGLKQYTKQVEKNNEMNKEEGGGWLSRLKGNNDHPIPQFAGQHSPIKHVIYVIKENRTYDQVLGDLAKGNGDPSMTEFGQQITPNIHKLADQFVTIDNFYGSGDASPVGHYWSMGAQANDHLEKEYRSSGHPYDYEGKDEANYTKGGFLWNNAANNGVSFRNYGEFIIPGANGQWVPSDPSIGNNYDPNFAGWTLKVNDRKRYEEWNNEFQQFVKNDNLPQLQVMLMPADHTSGTSTGSPTPQAMVADGDYALGKLVDTVSHSKYWEDTAIFVIEDDSQAGADHVDAHRMPVLVISPYTQTGKVDSSFYDTTSMVRTMEMILGMKPMSQFDASALPMLNAFTTKPNFDPYTVEEPQYPLDTLNGQSAPMADVSNKMDFSQPDSNDPQQLNKIIWKATKGDQPYPEIKQK